VVEFITLLLGLVVGPHTVEVAVQEPTARVELRIDGRPVAELSSEPWRSRIDFGARLAPRLLEAIAFDDQDNQVASARQIVNYARSNYEAVVVLDPARPDGGRTGSVIWQAVLDRKPKSIAVTLDGAEIPVDKSGRFELPPLDLDRVHSVSASVSFAGRQSAQADLVFGGAHGDRVSSALTAVPLLAATDRPLPPAKGMSGWFLSGDREIGVFAQPLAAARLMIVHDPAIRDELEELIPDMARLGRMPPQPVVTNQDSVRFVPISTVPRHPGHFRAVEVTPKKLRLGLWDLLYRSHPAQNVRGKRQLWAAVAAAGLGAVEGDHRRAVLILLGRSPRDASAIDPTQAIGYLRSVRAPHFLWAPRQRDLPTLRPGVEANTYVGAEGLLSLFDDLEESLRSQRIIWLEGLHFPERIRLSARVSSDYRLAR
jgi:hypothetical protein